MHYRIYLSSTRNLHPPLTNWKEDLKSNINSHEFFKAGNAVVTFIDPLMFESNHNPVVVQADTENISSADAIFFCIDRITIGTVMELAFSCMEFPNQKRYIITLNPEVANHSWIKNLTRDIPYGYIPLGRATLYPTIAQAVAAFVRDIENKR